MEQVIYGDILFAVNFSMDFLALYITAFIMRIDFKLIRGVAAAAVGGIYGVISIVVECGIAISLLFTVISGMLMCMILNGFEGIGHFTKVVVVFLISNLIIGGGMTALFSAFNSLGAARDLIIYGEIESVEKQMPLALFAFGSVVITLCMIFLGRVFSFRNANEKVELYIEYEGNSITINGIVDSGNLLSDPISGSAVIIINRKNASKLLSGQMLELLSEMKLTSKLYPFGKIRFIMCDTIVGRRALGAFRPGRVTVNGHNVSAWIAISDMESYGWKNTNGAIVPGSLVNI